jgi:hypothetical protein
MIFLLSLGESETKSGRELRQHSHHAEVTDPGGAKNKLKKVSFFVSTVFS